MESDCYPSQIVILLHNGFVSFPKVTQLFLLSFSFRSPLSSISLKQNCFIWQHAITEFEMVSKWTCYMLAIFVINTCNYWKMCALLWNSILNAQLTGHAIWKCMFWCGIIKKCKRTFFTPVISTAYTIYINKLDRLVFRFVNFWSYWLIPQHTVDTFVTALCPRSLPLVSPRPIRLPHTLRERKLSRLLCCGETLR